MAPKGFLSRRSKSKTLCGRTESASATTVAYGVKPASVHCGSEVTRCKACAFIPFQGLGLKSHMENCRQRCQTSKRFMKNSEIYLMPKSTATLTQSGLLAALLRHERQKEAELSRRLPRLLPWPFRRAHDGAVDRSRRRGFARAVRLHTWISPSE